MAVDVQRQRLFVAELGNNSVGVVDLSDRSISAAMPITFAWTAPRIESSSDTDVGALAIIDVNTRPKIRDIPLPAHPEGFQLDTASDQLFVNLPDRKTIAVVDAITGQQRARWAQRDAGGNFPMALDPSGQRALVVFRSPAKLRAYSIKDGRLLQSLEVCKDADDMFVDAKRQRVYVSCGEGFVDIFEMPGGAFGRSPRIATAPGARTSLFAPEFDLFLLAVRALVRGAGINLGIPSEQLKFASGGFMALTSAGTIAIPHASGQ
jgi:hypothetical protein